MASTCAVPHTFALLLVSLLAASCGRRQVPVVRPPPDGLLGLRYEAVSEGLVVTELVPGGGAEAAGLVPGALLLEVDGASLAGRPAGAGAVLAGAPGSLARVHWLPPLSTGGREAEVRRGAIGSRPVPRAVPRAGDVPASIKVLRRAVRDGSPREVDEAVDALVADGFGGRSPGRALRGPLRAAGQRGPAMARRMAERFSPHVGDDALALELLLGVAADNDDDAAVLALAPRFMAARPPDLRLADGTMVDLGGAAEARTAWIGALWRSGAQGEAIAQVRSLVATHDVPVARAHVGMAAPQQSPAAWYAALPPAPPVAVRTRSGQPWSLEAHNGEVVLLAFWATWCGPCLEELPALASLAKARPALQVLAVSMDEGPGAADKIDATVAELGLDLPVAHAPLLGRDYGIEALPSVRLVGRGGSVQHAARGHSGAGMARLSHAVEQALAAPVRDREPVGTRRGEGTLALTEWRPLAAVGEVAAAPGGAVVSVLGAAPLHLGGGGNELDVTDGGGGGPIAWLSGPVSGRSRGHWLRARTPDGTTRWLRTLPSPLVDVVVQEDLLYVALEDELVVLGADGALLGRHAGAVRGLAPASDGGVWAAGSDARNHARWDEAEGLVVASTPAAGVRRVGADGAILTGPVRQMVVGPFGPGGAERVVVALSDGRVIGLDGAGRPALVITMPDEVSLAVVQPDEGGALLAVAVPDLGIGLATLALP